MEIRKILVDLKAERDRLSQAIAALEALGSPVAAVAPRRVAATPKAAAKPFRKRRLTTSARKRLSDLMKARWAARRQASQKPSPKPTGSRRTLSAAARRKIAAAQRARWAARKKATAVKLATAKKEEAATASNAQ